MGVVLATFTSSGIDGRSRDFFRRMRRDFDNRSEVRLRNSFGIQSGIVIPIYIIMIHFLL